MSSTESTRTGGLTLPELLESWVNDAGLVLRYDMEATFLAICTKCLHIDTLHVHIMCPDSTTWMSECLSTSLALSLSLSLHVYACVCVCRGLCLCVCMYVCLFVLVHVCLYIDIYMHLYVCIYICTYAHIHTQTYAYNTHTHTHTRHTYVNTYMHTYIHTCIHLQCLHALLCLFLKLGVAMVVESAWKAQRGQLRHPSGSLRALCHKGYVKQWASAFLLPAAAKKV